MTKPFTFHLSPFRYPRWGFTLIETLVTIAVLGGIGLIIVSGLTSFREQAALDRAADEAVELLREARSRTLASEGARSYGVHFASSTMTLFPGGTFNAADPENVIVALPVLVEVSALELATTTASVVFRRLSGEAGGSGTVTFRNTRSGKAENVEILPSGVAVKR